MIKNKWLKVTDSDTVQAYKSGLRWSKNKFAPAVYDATGRFKTGEKFQVQYDKITKEMFILFL